MKSLKNWEGTLAVIGVDFGDSGKGRLVDELATRAHIVARYNGGSNAGHTVKNKYGKFALHIMPSGIFNPKTICLVGRGVAVNFESLVLEMETVKKVGVSLKNLLIDELATITMPWHLMRDGLREKLRKAKIGTTGSGVGPTYADRAERVGLRVKDLISANFKEKLFEEIKIQNKFFDLKLNGVDIFKKYQSFAKIIKPHVGQTIEIVKKAQKKNRNILFEGAQGFFLDIDAGTYPYVTSSNPGVVGIWRSFVIHPNELNAVIGISKSYITRVGEGPLPTELNGKIKKEIIEKGHEYGTTTGRERRPGWLDLVLIKAARDDNKLTSLALTKLDVLSGLSEIKVCIAYKLPRPERPRYPHSSLHKRADTTKLGSMYSLSRSHSQTVSPRSSAREYKKANKFFEYQSGDADYLTDCQPVYESLPGWSEDISGIRKFQGLPKNAQKFVKFIEKKIEVPVNFISVGPARGDAVYR